MDLHFGRSLRTILGLCIGLVALTVPAFANDVHGVMMVVKGEIKVTSAKDQKTEVAKVGKKVFSGDTIEAGKDSRSKIVMSDKNVLNVSPESKIIIEKYQNDGANKNVQLNVLYGKVRASVEQKYDGEKNKFNIKTPSAVAGVRGTDFMEGHVNGVTRVVTFSGSVAVGSPGPNGAIMNPVFVQPGMSAETNSSGKVEPPKAVPKEEMQTLNQETKAETAKATSEPAATTAEAKAEAKEEEKKEARKDEPVKEEKKEQANKDETKKVDEPKKEIVKDEPKKDAPTSNSQGNAQSTREPASIGPTSPAAPPPPAFTPSPGMAGPLITGADLPTGGNLNTIIPKAPIVAPPIYIPPVPVVTAPIIDNSLINGAIQNQKTRTTILITQ
jgi:hypothetical protein